MREGSPQRAGRELGTGAMLASISLIVSFAALGLNSITIARIEGADGAGLIALSTQFIFLGTFVAGMGLRTSIAYQIGAGLWSPRSAIRGALLACLGLGLIGGVFGMGVWALLRNHALDEFTPGMAAALMAALPFALAWWILPAIPLAREAFEEYALLTIAAPAGVVLLCPAGALLDGETGAVVGFAGGYVVGGLVCAFWALRHARRPDSARGPDRRLRDAGGFGARTWVNDLFQFINLRPDLFILAAYYGTSETGVYSVTVSITSLVWILSQPLASVVLPRTASIAAANLAEPAGDEVSTSSQVSAVRHSVLVSLVATLAVIPILAVAPLIWGPDFDRTLELGLIMVPGVALLGVGRVMVAAFTGHGAANQALLVGLVSFPLTLVAFLLVIPDYGATGAAVVSCCSYAVTWALAAFLFFRSTGASLAAALVPRGSDLRDYVSLVERLRSRSRSGAAVRTPSDG